MNFEAMHLDDVAAVNTAEALDWFWAHREFATYFTPERLEHYEIVGRYCAGLFPHSVGVRVIDFGCGPGQMEAALLERWMPDATVTGMDYAESAVAHAQKIAPRATFVVGDITQPILQRESARLVLCIECLEHIREWRRALDQMWRVLKPDYDLVLTVPNGEIDRGAAYHVNFWTREEIVGILSEYGRVMHHEFIRGNLSTLAHVRKDNR